MFYFSSVNKQKFRNGKRQRTSAPNVIRIRTSTGFVHVTWISPGGRYEFFGVICITYEKKTYNYFKVGNKIQRNPKDFMIDYYESSFL